jgi:drug/metabolite transporter (DMT)-like permease
MEYTLKRKEPARALVIAAFAAIYLIWGSTYIAILVAIRDIPPMLMAAIRFIIAGLLLFAYARIRGQLIPGIKSISKISFSGFLMLFLGTGAVVWAEQYISSGMAAIIVATLPLWFVLLDRRQWKFNFSNKWIITGLLVGFAGILTLFADKRSFDFSGSKMKLVSILILMIGTISWAAGSLYSKYKPVNGPSVMKASIQMFIAGLLFLIVSLITGEHHHVNWSGISLQSVLALVYLIIIGSLVGYMSYIWLLDVRPPALVGTYAYVNPVVAVFLGWLIASEPVVSRQVIALGVILAGVILVTLAKESKN